MTTHGQRPSGALRIRVMERDGYRCVYCGATSKEARLQVDHIVPVARGGTSDSTNLVTACFDCNNGKSDHAVTLPPHITATPIVVEPVWVRRTRVPPRRRHVAARVADWHAEAQRRYPDAMDMTWLVGRGRYASVAWCAGLSVALGSVTQPFLGACGHDCWHDHEIVDLSVPQVLDAAVERDRLDRRVAHFQACRTCRFVFDGRAVGDAVERASLRILQAERAPDVQVERWHRLASVPA